MAEGIMKDMLVNGVFAHECSLPIRVLSAGTYAAHGYPATVFAIRAAGENGIDIKPHRSQPLSDELVACADLILTMEMNHTAFIRNRWPEAGEISELKSLGMESDKRGVSDREIVDPIGLSYTVYQEVFYELTAEITRVSPLILSRAREKCGNR